MNWKAWRERMDFLRAVLNTVIFVSGAIGSIFNLIKGNNLPMIFSLLAMVFVVIFVITDLKSRRDRDAASLAAAAKAATTGGSVQSHDGSSLRLTCAHPVLVGQQTTSGASWYHNAESRLVIRLIRQCETSFGGG